MTQIQWQTIESMIDAMSPDDKQRLAAMLTVEPAWNGHKDSQAVEVSSAPPSRDPSNPSLGLFADEPELIDRIMKHVYHAREQHPLRASD